MANRWTNWAGNVRGGSTLAFPRDDAELAHVLRQAHARGDQVRVSGAGHSFSQLLAGAEVVVRLAASGTAVLEVDPSSCTARVNAGARLHDLSRELDTYGLAFDNLGDIDVQTLAGAISTATHGTGQRLPSLSGQVSGVRMMTARGELLDFDDSNLTLLRAAQVSLGALGVIVEAELALRPSFHLHRTTSMTRLAEVLGRAESAWSAHRNYEFFVIPFSGYALEVTHDETSEPAMRTGAADDTSGLRQLAGVRTFLGRFPPLRRAALAAACRFSGTEEVIGPSWQVLSSERTIKFVEMEYHLPPATALAALSEVLSVIEQHRREVYFPIECRRTAGDNALMSPFNGGERISVAVHADIGDDHRWFYELAEPIFRRHGGRPHWGKLHSLARRDVLDLYPDAGEFTRVRDEMDPTGMFLNAHLAALLPSKVRR